MTINNITGDKIKSYITIADNTSEKHRSKIIIHKGYFYFAEFDTIEQLVFFAETLGFSFTFREIKHCTGTGTIHYFDVNRDFADANSGGFWDTSELPEGAKPIKALSNGSIVTCYYTNDGKTITMYRPNPNARNVYKPLSIPDAIAHKRIYGTY